MNKKYQQIDFYSDKPQQDLTEDKYNKKRYRSYSQCCLIAANAALAAFYNSYTQIYISTFQFQFIAKLFDIQSDLPLYQGLLTSVVFMGAILGTLFIFLSAQNLTRRQSFLLVIIIAMAAGFTVLFQIPFQIFIVSRLIQGFCVGAFSALAPIYIKQNTPVEISGPIGTFWHIFLVTGFLVAFSLQFLLKQFFKQPEIYWRYLFGLTMLTLTIQLISFLFIFQFQTMKFQILQGNYSQVRRIIQIIYLQQFHEQIYQELNSDLRQIQKDQNFGQIFQDSEDQIKKQRWGKYLSIFCSFYLSVSFTFTGVTTITINSQQLIASVFPQIKQAVAIMLSAVQVISSFFCPLIFNLFDRKTIQLAGTLICSICTFTIAFSFYIKREQSYLDQYAYPTLFAMIVFRAFFGSTIGAAYFVYISQTIQPNICSLNIMLIYLTGSLALFLFPIISQKMPNHNPFPIFSFYFIWTIVAFFINSKLMIETKGKSQKQIIQKYRTLKIC